MKISILLLLLGSLFISPTALAQPASGLWVRVELLKPQAASWRVHVISHQPNGKTAELHSGATTAPTAEAAGWLKPGEPGKWLDLTEAVTGVSSVRFIFATDPPPKDGIQARFSVGTAATPDRLVRTITEHDPGNVISLRLPANLVKDRQWLLSIREDTRRRLEEVNRLRLPAGPLPRRIWTMTGFRANGQFYTDPAITRLDFEIIRKLGMNGFWEQNGGHPGYLRRMAEEFGIGRSTVYWRSTSTPLRDPAFENAATFNREKQVAWLEDLYHRDIASTRAAHPQGMPVVIADLMDEPAGEVFDGPDYHQAFREYLQQQGFTPDFFGKNTWAEITAPKLGWWTYFKDRAALPENDLPARRRWYWGSRFWNHATAWLYAIANRKVAEEAPGVGTRVNFGPPWFYDYGTLPRGTDIFEFGRLHGVSLGFNEDWIGSGSPRLPLEFNTLLMDWSRAAMRPAEPLLGSYITRDNNRTAVKLRTFACLARGAKVFDFYYYGPSYTFFDHWSDNSSMVQGVGELTRDLGAVDNVLYEAQPPRARVALLYSRSWPVWKTDDSEQIEQMMAYLALLHAGIPVDLVTDEEVADGRFAARPYRCLYVVNESIPLAAQTAIVRWVRAGGRLWASGWAGLRDEYNTPATTLNELLGLQQREWKPAGDLARWGEVIRPDDWKRPIFPRQMTLRLAPDAAATELPGANQPAAYRRSYGAGSVQVVPWSAGYEYMQAAKENQASLAKAVIFPDDHRRSIYSALALGAGVRPPAVTTASQVLAWPLWTQQQGVLLLANFTGEPHAAVTVRFSTPLSVRRVHSLRQGTLQAVKQGEDWTVTLPLREVTDILEIN